MQACGCDGKSVTPIWGEEVNSRCVYVEMKDHPGGWAGDPELRI